jgi:glutaredoxin
MPSYQAVLSRFEGSNVQVLGISVDHVPCLQAWAGSLGGITYSLLSDFWPHGAVAEKYGVLRSDGKSERAIFIIDKTGIIQYVDIHDIDDQPSNDVLFDELALVAPEDFPAEMQPKPVELPHGGVVIYCTRWCNDCKRAKLWMTEHHIPYREVDITTTPGAAAQVREWARGYETTPTFDIDGTILVDYDENQLREILKI